MDLAASSWTVNRTDYRLMKGSEAAPQRCGAETSALGIARKSLNLAFLICSDRPPSV
jgi:hypothetical protein